MPSEPSGSQDGSKSIIRDVLKMAYWVVFGSQTAILAYMGPLLMVVASGLNGNNVASFSLSMMVMGIAVGRMTIYPEAVA